MELNIVFDNIYKKCKGIQSVQFKQFKYTAISLIFISIFTTGCLNKNLHFTQYKSKINTKEKIPQICKSEYNAVLPRVAVVDFTNNSSFGKAKTDNKSKSIKGGVGVFPTFIGVKGESVSRRTNRNVDPKLSSAIVPLVESMILKTGGATLISRADMEKVDTELKLQDSGLLDPNTVVEFGKNSGVQYIVTGSINYVKRNYSGYSSASQAVHDVTKNNSDPYVQIAGALIHVGTVLFDTMNIYTSATIKVIDVSTGEIAFTKNIAEEIDIGNYPNPTYGQIVGGIKAAIAKSLPQLKDDFQRYFSIQGYITQIRKNGDDFIVQLSLGNQYKIEPNQLFKVYTFEENTDPLTNKVSCEKIELPVVLKATKQISNTHTWAVVDEGEKEMLKLLQVVQKKQEDEGWF